MKKHRLSLIFITLPLLCALIGAGAYFAYSRYFHVAFAPQDYTETDAALQNPCQGWYHLYGYVLSDAAPPDTETIQKHCADSSEHMLALLEINLREYADRDLSETALSELDTVFSTWEQSGVRLIVRFLYDWNGMARETEPKSISQIKQHMKQAAAVVNRHRDSIYLLQGIFVGNNGEMNNSDYMQEDSMAALAQYLASVTDPSIYLSVRTPAHWRAINARFEPLAETEAHSGSLPARLGLFNDGMLGSANDLGTYGDSALSEADGYSAKGTRAEEIAFQNELCRYVPNGGEAILDNPYNDLDNAIADLSAMHVSYLNADYDKAVLDKWQAASYRGTDCFQGADGLSYITAHLGYRYHISDVSCAFDTWRDETATLNLTIANSGFSPSYCAFASQLRLKNTETGEQTVLPADLDTRAIQSGGSAVCAVPLDVRSMPCGTYRIYYEMTDPATGRYIRFANRFLHTAAGYPVGSLTIRKQPD